MPQRDGSSPKRRRVGIHERVAAPERERPSKLMDVLLEELGLGFISSPAVVRIAGAAVADGLDLKEVRSAARCGNDGLYPGNCWRDLTRGIKGILGDAVPPPHYVKAHGFPQAFPSPHPSPAATLLADQAPPPARVHTHALTHMYIYICMCVNTYMYT